MSAWNSRRRQSGICHNVPDHSDQVLGPRVSLPNYRDPLRPFKPGFERGGEMIKRDLQDGTSLFILQEDHADLAAQFAAHWGNERFAKLEPYESMVFAGIYHDSDHRETEADIPIDSEKELPHGHRTVPFSPKRIVALSQNIDWVTKRDPYAGLIVQYTPKG